jgi:hypothetical protein
MRYSGRGETPVDSDFGGRIVRGMWQFDCLKLSNHDPRPINVVRFVSRCDDDSTSWID